MSQLNSTAYLTTIISFTKATHMVHFFLRSFFGCVFGFGSDVFVWNDTLYVVNAYYVFRMMNRYLPSTHEKENISVDALSFIHIKWPHLIAFSLHYLFV